MKIRNWKKVPIAALPALGLSVVLGGYPNQMRALDATDAASTGTVAPTQVNLPLVPAEVLRMSEAGMSDDVIVSYIEKSANPYTLDAAQIIYLHDMGISSAVLNVLVEHGQTAINDQTAEASSDTTENPAPATSTETLPVNGAAIDYYNALASYGTWVNVPTYGWCWQPSVVAVNSSWQPYSDNGCWLWTDQGWYWNSYYSWGWAPFHYGRWCQYPGYGWLWCPDRIWGPAWVCWREYPGYCGWAPLPPGACFTVGIGWTFNRVAVGFNFGFGLGPRCFTFCDYDDFCHRFGFHHFLHGRDADRFFEQSRVDNDFALDAQHHFFNRGIDPSRIEATTHKQIGQVAVRELPRWSGHSGDIAMPDRLIRNGNNQVIYRPGQDLSGMRNRFFPERHTEPVSHWNTSTGTHGFNAGHVSGNQPRFQASSANGWQRSAPDLTWNRSAPNAFNQRGGTGNFQASHSLPAPAYRRDYSDSQRSTPVWHPAPAWHSVPLQSLGGASSGGGMHFGGSAGRFGGRMSGGGLQR